MKLEIIETIESGARMTQTSFDHKIKINPILTAEVITFVNIHKMKNLTPYTCLEIYDWEVCYYLGDERCKRDGVEELADKLFYNLSIDKVEKEIENMLDEKLIASYIGDEFDLVENFSKCKLDKLIKDLIKKCKIQTYGDIKFTRDWHLIYLAKLVEDENVQSVKVLTDFDYDRINKGHKVLPTEKEVYLIS